MGTFTDPENIALLPQKEISSTPTIGIFRGELLGVLSFAPKNHCTCGVPFRINFKTMAPLGCVIVACQRCTQKKQTA